MDMLYTCANPDQAAEECLPCMQWLAGGPTHYLSAALRAGMWAA